MLEISIQGLNNEGPLYAKRIDDFFREFLMCFIGDRNVDDDTRNLIKLKKNENEVLKIDIRQEERRKRDRKKILPSTNYEKINLNSNEPAFKKTQKVAPIVS